MDLMSLIIACVPGVPPSTLYAVVQHESGGNAFAINLNSKTHRLTKSPTTRAEALHTLSLLHGGDYGSYDIGLGQINSKNLARFGIKPEAALNPCLNLRLSARVLTECHTRAAKNQTSNRMAAIQISLAKALSCYNTGSFTRGMQNGYVAKVYRQAQQGARRGAP